MVALFVLGKTCYKIPTLLAVVLLSFLLGCRGVLNFPDSPNPSNISGIPGSQPGPSPTPIPIPNPTPGPGPTPPTPATPEEDLSFLYGQCEGAYKIDKQNRISSFVPFVRPADAGGIYGITADPFGRFLYTSEIEYGDRVRAGKNQLIAYQVDQRTGAWQIAPNSPINLEPFWPPKSMAVSIDGRFLYVPLFTGTNVIYKYAVDQSTGALQYVSTIPSPGGYMLQSDPLGRFIFQTGGQGTVSVLKVDASSGELEIAPGSPYAFPGWLRAPSALKVDPKGEFLYISDGVAQSRNLTVYRINAGGGLVLAPGNPFSSGDELYSISVSPSGDYLYTTSNFPGGIYGFRVNRETGELLPLPGSPFVSGMDFEFEDAAIDPSGKYIYAGTYAGLIPFQISESGVLTPMSPIPPRDACPPSVYVTPRKP